MVSSKTKVKKLKLAPKKDYPFLNKYKIPFISELKLDDGKPYLKEYCPFKATHVRLVELGIADQFHKLFGTQTMYLEGMYPWDAEAVMCRIMTGRLTGTQLLMD
jgi:hypothetical protein